MTATTTTTTTATTTTTFPLDGPATRPARHRLLLVASGGGHLGQLLTMQPWLQHHERTWVTFDTASAGAVGDAPVVFAHHPTTRSLRNLVRNVLLAWTVLRRERPDAVVSTGAGVALPFFLMAKVLGIRTVFIEVYDRIDSRSLTGRLCRPLSDLFLLQWERQRELYGSGTVIGGLYP
jgi:UDP-N-acetylglucosamine:LPS N-acetylglucosamine transferase